MIHEENWWSMSKVTLWLWEGLFSKKTFIAVTLISGLFIAQTSRPYLALFAPIYFLPYAFFVMLLNLASFIGDIWADWLMSKIIKSPGSNNIFHKLLYLFFSSFCLPLGLFFITSGEINDSPHAVRFF